jgi:hypothetical protein
MASGPGTIDQNLPNINASYAGWVEVLMGSIYYGFSGTGVTSLGTVGLYTNNITGADSGALQVYTLTSAWGALGSGVWGRINANLIMVFPVVASGGYQVVFRGTVPSGSGNCYFRANCSVKVYAN